MKRKGVRKSALGVFRRSLPARAVLFTVLLSGVALVALGGFLAYSIGNGLYQTRLQQSLSESKQAVIEVQNTFSAASVTDDVALQTLMNSVVPKLESSSANQSRKVALIRSPGQTTTVILQSPISAELDPSLIPLPLRDKVALETGKLVYQSIALPGVGSPHPGLVIGSAVYLPIAGNYELYLVYDLQSDQETLDFMQRSLIIGGLFLIVAIGLVSFFVTNLLVKPVLIAATASEKLANGDFTQRLQEKGEDPTAILAKSFNQMADSLQEQINKYESVSKVQQRFVSDVSHELRTPLTTIKLAGDVIFNSRDQLTGPLNRSAEIMHEQIERFQVLLTDLLEISRYDAGAVNPEFESVDLNGIVGMAIVGLEPLASSRGSKIRVDIPSGPVECEMDPSRIERLIRNLLANAIEHGEGSPIDVAVGQNKSSVAVTVTDFGIGMTKAETERVFDRFWRADPSRKRTTGGTGLGLAISLEDAHLHSGWLQVWSEPGNGSCFRLTLPKNHGLTIRNSPLPMPPEAPLGKNPSPKVAEAKA